ncbi:MAG TPA: hypothetical protein VLE43_03020 [Candidatus Saccharimonadia bacterium]|nr:hypothetical protein [Candidatus Saccharimonadia bacterium]
MAKGPGQPGPRPAPAAPVGAPSSAEEKAGFFGRIGKMFSKKEAAPAPTPAALPTTPRRPMPAATAARLAGAVPPGGPPGQQAPGPAAQASKRTEAVSVVPFDDADDDSPEAAVRPVEDPQKKSLTEASPAKDASVEDKVSATNRPENTQGAGVIGAEKPAESAEQTPAPVIVSPAAKPAVSSSSAPAPFVATPASIAQHASRPWSFSNEAMAQLAERLHPKNQSTNGKTNGNGNGNGHSNGKPNANGHGEVPSAEEPPLSQSPSHEAMVWLARCLREFHQARNEPESNQRVAMFAKEETHLHVPAIPSAALPEMTAPLSLETVMRDLVRSRRLISYSMLAGELEQRLSRSVTMDETNAAAKASGDIHVYGEGNSAGYLWQGH